MNEIGTGRPVKDELKLGDFEPKKIDLPEDVTTDEEVAPSGIWRLRRGAWWVGRRIPLPTHRKGTRKDFVDGGFVVPWSTARGESEATE